MLRALDSIGKSQLGVSEWVSPHKPPLSLSLSFLSSFGNPNHPPQRKEEPFAFPHSSSQQASWLNTEQKFVIGPERGSFKSMPALPYRTCEIQHFHYLLSARDLESLLVTPWVADGHETPTHARVRIKGHIFTCWKSDRSQGIRDLKLFV
jgi:hypothetical protein